MKEKLDSKPFVHRPVPASGTAALRAYWQLAKTRLFTIWLGPVLAGSLAFAGGYPAARWVFAGGVALILSGLSGIRYSSGIMLSRRFTGSGELLTGAMFAATVALPYAAITGQLTTAAIAESALLGLWFVQILICSNTADAVDDRAAGRRTVAAVLSPRANRFFVAGVFLLNWTIAISAIATGVVSPWAGMLLQPVWMLEGYVLYRAMRGTWRLRRNYGFVALLCGVVGLAVSNVLV